MWKIKTRDNVERTIRTIDKAATAAGHTKDVLVKTKEKSQYESGSQVAAQDPVQYATDKISEASNNAADEAGAKVRSGVYTVVRKGKNIRTGRKNVQSSSGNSTTPGSGSNGSGAPNTAAATSQQPTGSSSPPLQTSAQGNAGGNGTARSNVTGNGNQKAGMPQVQNKPVQHGNPALQNGKVKSANVSGALPGSSGRGSVRQPTKTVKTHVQSVPRTASKTVRTGAGTAKKAVSAGQMSRIKIKTAVQATKTTAKATTKSARVTINGIKAMAKALKVAVKAVVEAVKAAIAAIKTLVAAIASAGIPAAVVVIIVCIVGLVAGSCFGIFFSGQDSGSGITMQDAVKSIDREYQDKISTIRNNNAYDIVEMSGSQAVWKDVLSIYAVKTTTDPANACEVATMDADKLQILDDIFWQMNVISSRTAVENRTKVTETDDGEGNIIQTTQNIPQTCLYISVAHLTADEMAVEYGFSDTQMSSLHDIISDAGDDLWNSILPAACSGNDSIVQIALTQIGNSGGQTYWSWYGFGSRVEWCACFVSWCADQCGYIDSGTIPKYASCTVGMQWFKDHGQWQDNSYSPAPGDIVFFDWKSNGLDGTPDHTGIVEKVENSRLYTIEGNSNDTVCERSYPLGYYQILGYGIPAY